MEASLDKGELAPPCVLRRVARRKLATSSASRSSNNSNDKNTCPHAHSHTQHFMTGAWKCRLGQSARPMRWLQLHRKRSNIVLVHPSAPCFARRFNTIKCTKGPPTPSTTNQRRKKSDTRMSLRALCSDVHMTSATEGATCTFSVLMRA